MWQTIDTAPLDGTPIIACRFGYEERDDLGIHPRTVRFEVYHPNAPGKGHFRNHLGHKEHWITHWMPMLEPPRIERDDTRREEKVD